MRDARTAGEGRFASTWQNRAAGRALREARLACSDGLATQSDFAVRLATGLGIEISGAALSNWESGRRSVPTAVLIEAGLASGISVDALFARVHEPRLGDIAEGAREADVASLLQEQKQDLVSVRREIQNHARLLARMRRSLEKAGISLAESSAEGRERRGEQAM